MTRWFARGLRVLFWSWFVGGVALGMAAHANPSLKGFLFEVAHHAMR
ncbi:hypothetical protein H0I76_04630 [Limibaculum sp. M0105]|uniref:Uncharacterized protein n=1 Tax=Thermohalobaculum xanthum TaxID=2753746 RepID=A0A8J7M4Y9_9RHOB|nr:hypothetical protein [Thermohalobaculum xanthum]MBK0398464.1 hypothetical protein [Thermohalobaculum xanthum]